MSVRSMKMQYRICKFLIDMSHLKCCMRHWIRIYKHHLYMYRLYHYKMQPWLSIYIRYLQRRKKSQLSDQSN